jgi:hypothetical protein
VEQLLDRQSQEADAGKRKALVWEIERRLAEDVANPIILHAVGYGCRNPTSKAPCCSRTASSTAGGSRTSGSTGEIDARRSNSVHGAAVSLRLPPGPYRPANCAWPDSSASDRVDHDRERL